MTKWRLALPDALRNHICAISDAPFGAHVGQALAHVQVSCPDLLHGWAVFEPNLPESLTRAVAWTTEQGPRVADVRSRIGDALVDIASDAMLQHAPISPNKDPEAFSQPPLYPYFYTL